MAPAYGKKVKNLKTGMCAVGWCEGTRPTTPSGKKPKTCLNWQTCACKCHAELTKMFEMSGMERIAVENPEYVPFHRTWWMPGDDEHDTVHTSASLSTDSVPVAPIMYESPAPGVLPAVRVRDFGQTATGRAARGELELWVKQVCDVFVVDGWPNPCTPAAISEQIGKDQGINPPSTGAVDAVLKRWVTLGFAVTGSKPTRFLSYTPEGIEMGLDRMKEKAKRLKKQAQAAQHRGART
jgi:hypothetical protein